MAGRKALHNPENLKIGERIELKGSRKEYGHQYAYNWSKKVNKNKKGWDFKCVNKEGKVFIERIS